MHFDAGADNRLEVYGDLPVPPYITEAPKDSARYQTVYATVPGLPLRRQPACTSPPN